MELIKSTKKCNETHEYHQKEATKTNKLQFS